jgi:hypothetical protein
MLLHSAQRPSFVFYIENGLGQVLGVVAAGAHHMERDALRGFLPGLMVGRALNSYRGWVAPSSVRIARLSSMAAVVEGVPHSEAYPVSRLETG